MCWLITNQPLNKRPADRRTVMKLTKTSDQVEQKNSGSSAAAASAGRAMSRRGFLRNSGLMAGGRPLIIHSISVRIVQKAPQSGSMDMVSDASSTRPSWSMGNGQKYPGTRPSTKSVTACCRSANSPGLILFTGWVQPSTTMNRPTCSGSLLPCGAPITLITRRVSAIQPR